MRDELYGQTARVEESHWWFIYRRKLASFYLNKINKAKIGSALDIGCGSGGNLSVLKQFYPDTKGLDYSEKALDIARKKYPDHQFIHGDLNDLDRYFNKHSFDLVTLFSVLYHKWVCSEEDVLKKINTILKPGGYILLNEPAFKCLFRDHDRVDYGKTRYQIKEIKSFLLEADFELISASYFNVISFIPAWILALYQRRKKDKLETGAVNELNVPPYIINKLMLILQTIELLYIKCFGCLPVGVSLICLARKK